ncbi:efflux RND transporter periplasmic adaptor subunit [Cognaticolwellia beringensis]|uniref:Efflux transporter periplasmic adaptor subunit n=1 Tax=Cognaticolwellia beringensis TaxID=1967665 RepID=A0A222G8S4_9GAMM|nr:efflux RND transporter periplasmic adaptor subunit [Cognaticolwellia beringensis]ASP48308.1 efflux transporter periplasmic adaptor subunit [Cognaticolwellia beringensis]
MTIISNSSRLFILSVAVLIFISGCSEQPIIEKTEAAPRPVKLITIASADDSRVFTYPATLDAVHSSKLNFQVGGKLEKLNVIAAQDVAKGDELASLEKRGFINQLNSAKAQFEAAESDFIRGTTLSKTGVISARDLEQLKSKKEVAESTYDSALKAIADSTLIAPYDAVVAAVPAKVLENITPGQHILTLFGKGQMEAIVNIPASIVATVNTRTDRQAFVILDAAPNELIHATYRRANLEADSASQTYEVRFVFTAPEGLNILPGMNASLQFKLTSPSKAHTVAVPTFAIFQENGQHYVWKVSTDSMQVSKAPVTIADGIGEELVITSGLNPGDTIVGAGANYLTEGMIVSSWSKS